MRYNIFLVETLKGEKPPYHYLISINLLLITNLLIQILTGYHQQGASTPITIQSRNQHPFKNLVGHYHQGATTPILEMHDLLEATTSSKSLWPLFKISQILPQSSKELSLQHNLDKVSINPNRKSSLFITQSSTNYSPL